MSSEPLSEVIQLRQRSNGDVENVFTPTCSTPAAHGDRTTSPRPDVLSKDSGISQVFFPPDFEGNSTVGSPLSPVLVDNVYVMNTPVEHRSRRNCTWIRFILLWVGVLLTAFVIHYGSMKFWEYKTAVSDFVSYHGWKCCAYVALVCTFLLSFLMKCCYDRKCSQSLNEESSGHIAKNTESNRTGQRPSASATTTHRDFPCRRTFSGTNNDTWHDFKKYFENLAVLNNWSKEQSRRTLLCSLRGQAETFAYGLPVVIQNDWDSLFSRMEQRFGIMNMKDSYIADARLRRKKKDETYREFGQAIEDLFRKAYPHNIEIVEEQAIITFLDNCHESTDFRLAVKRTRPKTLHEAITSSVQEESLRLTERERSRSDSSSRPIFNMAGTRGRSSYRGRGRGYRNQWKVNGARSCSTNQGGAETNSEGARDNNLN